MSDSSTFLNRQFERELGMFIQGRLLLEAFQVGFISEGIDFAI
jgi:hypothetical protein